LQGIRYYPALVIRLRSLIERGCTHPVLGPILLVVLVLMLAMLFLHLADDGHGAASDFGAVCVALAAFLGSLVLKPFVGDRRESTISTRVDRGPPSLGVARIRPRFALVSTSSLSLPLRR
jgi:peptidoglycan/LPS O-acetylase OafA/YrhL